MKEHSYHKIEARFGLSMTKTAFCLTILINLNFLSFLFKFWVIFPYFKRGQLPSSRHTAVLLIAPDSVIEFVSCLSFLSKSRQLELPHPASYTRWLAKKPQFDGQHRCQINLYYFQWFNLQRQISTILKHVTLTFPCL